MSDRYEKLVNKLLNKIQNDHPEAVSSFMEDNGLVWLKR